MRNILFIILIVSVYGCHSGTFIAYEQGEAQLSKDQVALIKPYPGGGLMGLMNGGDFIPRSVEIYFEGINGTSMEFYDDVEVLPGNCTVHYYYFRTLVSGTYSKTIHGSVQFQAEAGHTYMVGISDSYLPNSAWVEDTATGTAIVGTP